MSPCLVQGIKSILIEIETTHNSEGKKSHLLFAAVRVNEKIGGRFLSFATSFIFSGVKKIVNHREKSEFFRFC